MCYHVANRILCDFEDYHGSLEKTLKVEMCLNSQGQSWSGLEKKMSKKVVMIK